MKGKPENPGHYSLGKAMSLTLRSLRCKLQEDLSELGIQIPIEQYFVLKFVAYHQADSQQQLANILSKDKSAIQRLISQLQEKKYVARIPDSSDRRKNHLVLTQAGADFLKDAERAEEKMISHMTRGIPEKDMEVFCSVLEKIRLNSPENIN